MRESACSICGLNRTSSVKVPVEPARGQRAGEVGTEHGRLDDDFDDVIQGQPFALFEGRHGVEWPLHVDLGGERFDAETGVFEVESGAEVADCEVVVEHSAHGCGDVAAACVEDVGVARHAEQGEVDAFDARPCGVARVRRLGHRAVVAEEAAGAGCGEPQRHRSLVRAHAEEVGDGGSCSEGSDDARRVESAHVALLARSTESLLDFPADGERREDIRAGGVLPLGDGSDGGEDGRAAVGGRVSLHFVVEAVQGDSVDEGGLGGGQAHDGPHDRRVGDTTEGGDVLRHLARGGFLRSGDRVRDAVDDDGLGGGAHRDGQCVESCGGGELCEPMGDVHVFLM
jgi:hypothetical protein